MRFLKANLLSLIALLVMIAASAILWNSMPETVATRFDWQGNVIGTGNKALAVILVPLVYIAVIAGVNILVRISPSKFSMPNSKRAMDIIVFGLGVMMTFLHLGLLLNGGDNAVFQRYFAMAMASFLIITGNVFGKTERNFFMGIRLPWTIASAANWKVTHRLAGTLMVISGIALALISLVYSHGLLTVTLCLAPILIPAIYSPIYYWRYEHSQQSTD